MGGGGGVGSRGGASAARCRWTVRAGEQVRPVGEAQPGRFARRARGAQGLDAWRDQEGHTGTRALRQPRAVASRRKPRPGVRLRNAAEGLRSEPLCWPLPPCRGGGCPSIPAEGAACVLSLVSCFPTPSSFICPVVWICSPSALIRASSHRPWISKRTFYLFCCSPLLLPPSAHSPRSGRNLISAPSPSLKPSVGSFPWLLESSPESVVGDHDPARSVPRPLSELTISTLTAWAPALLALSAAQTHHVPSKFMSFICVLTCPLSLSWLVSSPFSSKLGSNATSRLP